MRRSKGRKRPSRVPGPRRRVNVPVAPRQAVAAGPAVLQVEQIGRPGSGPGQVLVRVRAAPVNPVDWKLCQGDLKAMLVFAASGAEIKTCILRKQSVAKL